MEDKPYNILVVDDDQIVASYIKDLLQNEEFNVTVIDNGKTALNELNNNIFDLVLLDIIMPDINGYEVLRQIREQSNIPVIMLTSVIEPTSAAKSLDIGADDYIRKPFIPQVLVALINAKIRRSKKTGGK